MYRYRPPSRRLGYGKIAVAVGLCITGLVQVSQYATWWFIQNINLIFHEAGHVLMALLGELPYLFGGTIFEVGIPLLCAVYFSLQGQYFAAAVCSWWLGTGLLSVSIYINDAVTRSLPLITGDPATHDWYQILSHLEALQHHDVLAGVVWSLAVASFVSILGLLYYDTDVQAVFKTGFSGLLYSDEDSSQSE